MLNGDVDVAVERPETIQYYNSQVIVCPVVVAMLFLDCICRWLNLKTDCCQWGKFSARRASHLRLILKPSPSWDMHIGNTMAYWTSILWCIMMLFGTVPWDAHSRRLCLLVVQVDVSPFYDQRVRIHLKTQFIYQVRRGSSENPAAHHPLMRLLTLSVAEATRSNFLNEQVFLLPFSCFL